MKDRGSRKMTRRAALTTGAAFSLGSTLDAAPPTKSIYESFGLKRVINAGGTFTNLGGSLMPPEVASAWVEASKDWVNLPQLQERVGEKIAKLIGVEAALVTTGAAGALLLGTAAVVTRGDRDLLKRLPDTSGMKNEVLIQKSHHSCYDNQMTNVGVKLIDVETTADVKKVINDRTALMFFMNYVPDSKISREQWIELARKHKVPTLLDAAADAPPVERLSEYCRMGFDLVAFSGGKAMRGPNDTGLLLGNKVFIDAARLNTNPNCPSIGRMMKVGKEDLVALYVAVERFVNLDHKAELRQWQSRISLIEKAVKGIPTVECEIIVPPIANHVPHLQIAWDEKRLKITREQLTKQLADGDPSIVIARVHGSGERGILISVFVLKDGEDSIVADRLKALLSHK